MSSSYGKQRSRGNRPAVAAVASRLLKRKQPRSAPFWSADKYLSHPTGTSVPDRHGPEAGVVLLERLLDWNVEGNRVHDAQALELHPNAICARSRKGQVKLDLR